MVEFTRMREYAIGRERRTVAVHRVHGTALERLSDTGVGDSEFDIDGGEHDALSVFGARVRADESRAGGELRFVLGELFVEYVGVAVYLFGDVGAFRLVLLCGGDEVLFQGAYEDYGGW
mmetsp:Transcript_11631/g.25123  ORF Transcript_11631/g.25123 Transcript_11631/m.25123 type:complete len:119 (-) Transcript_11631:471-827(-)|eukprot:CAMPEP_0196226446 /NCGR_PEP_ID=MMETSP0912-20130531/50407_1 /TAXON_ID=49265 /ORGANISM="Thalassiosira rotula, Strain GSO102" /LENGTH=118 /DNA_ID=CAMNT_0041505943 /DNA_START=1 /DNA_END=354 /DNA_ORIENTATION=+